MRLSLLMVALKFYIQHLCRAISIWAANAIETDNSLAVMKVALAAPSQLRVGFAGVAELWFCLIWVE